MKERKNCNMTGIHMDERTNEGNINEDGLINDLFLMIRVRMRTSNGEIGKNERRSEGKT